MSALLAGSTTLPRAPRGSSAFSLVRAQSAPRAIIPKFPKSKALHTVYSLSGLEEATVAFATQSSITENVVDRQYATQSSEPLGGWRHCVMQLLLWEWRRKTNQLSGLKSPAINSGFNYPEQSLINICKLHPTYFHTNSESPREPRSEGHWWREFRRSRIQQIFQHFSS